MKRSRAEKTAVTARLKREGTPCEASLEKTTEESTIPDYVMHDFGDLGESSNEPSVRPRVSETWAQEEKAEEAERKEEIAEEAAERPKSEPQSAKRAPEAKPKEPKAARA